MGKNIDKYISKSLNTKYSQKRLDHANNLPQLDLKLFVTKQFKKKAEETGALVGKVPRKSPQNKSGRVERESETENIGFDREIPEERYMSREKRQNVIDDLRLI